MADQTHPQDCPGCGRPRDPDPSVPCPDPGCPSHDEPEAEANRPTGGEDIGA